MQQIIKMLAASLCVVALLAACNNQPTGNDPNEVLNNFFVLLAKKDLEGAERYVTSDSKATMKMIRKGIEMAEQQTEAMPQRDLLKDFENLSLAPAVISEDTASIRVTAKKGKQPATDFILIRESGGWKVDFTMSTLMKMGLQAGEETRDLMDPAAVEKTQQLYDSVVRNIDPETLDALKKQLDKLK